MQKEYKVHNPKSVLKNETQKRLNDFEIQTDHLITAWRNDSQYKKGTCWIVDFAVLEDHRIKLKERKKRDKSLDLARELKNYESWRWWLYQL